MNRFRRLIPLCRTPFRDSALSIGVPLALAVWATLNLALETSVALATSPPPIVIITVDDMSADSVGAFGCRLADTTPHIDRLANDSLRFQFAHVQAGNCMPSRNVMWSGLYSHQNRVQGFRPVTDPNYPVLADLMKQAGYFTAIRGKVAHSTPYSPYAWDLVLDKLPSGQVAHIKDADSYGISTKQAIAAARDAGDRPLCLMVNISDPHKPFFAEARNGQTIPDPHVPTRIFTPDEVPIPGFLHDSDVIRKELAHYYSSVRRADDCVGAVLSVLTEEGLDERAMILFCSDHGMPLPFAKTQLYHHSSRTPLVIRLPGITTAGSIDRDHLVSSIDFLPTLLEVAGAQRPAHLEGVSLVPLLRGEQQSGREFIVKAHHENAGGSRDPMRGIESKKYLYLFNPWSDGSKVMATATQGTPTWKWMVAEAATDPKVAARVEMMKHRVPEEFYDLETDPDCLDNRISDANLIEEIRRHRETLIQWMVKTKDPMLDTLRVHDDPAARERYMASVLSAARNVEPRNQRAAGNRQRAVGNSPGANRPSALTPPGAMRGAAVKTSPLLVGSFPDSAPAGDKLEIALRLPNAPANPTRLTVTLKDAEDGKRLDRQIVAVADAAANVVFDLAPQWRGRRLQVAAFIGEDFTSTVAHIQSAPIVVR